MMQFFSELSKPNKGVAFEKFLISVLQQQALKMKKDIKFNTGLDTSDINLSKSGDFLFDAYAPNGFDTNIPTLFEFKLQISNRIENIISQLYAKIRYNNRLNNFKLIIITYSDLEGPQHINSRINYINQESIDVEIWDKHIVDSLINEYPIDYQNTIAFFINKSVTNQNVISDFDITDADFDKKNENNSSSSRARRRWNRRRSG